MNAGFIERCTRQIIAILHEHSPQRENPVDIRALSIEEAYAVQEQYLATRAAVGEQFIGYKVGCTSSAIRDQFGLSEPICGRLLAPYIHRNGDALPINHYLDCALEAELVFHIGSDLDGRILGTDYLRSAIVGVSPGIEIHNYRFHCGHPSLQELIASNGIHAGLVIGDAKPLCNADLGQERSTLTVNGLEMASGDGANLMEGRGPIESLRWLLVHLRKRNSVLKAGSLVIPGSAAKLVGIKGGDVAEARFTSFGVCRATFCR